MRTKRTVRSQVRKLNWLAANPQIWEAFPKLDHPVRLPRCRQLDPYHVRTRWTIIVAALKRAGLVSGRTYSGDIRVDFLVSALRRQLRTEREEQNGLHTGT